MHKSADAFRTISEVADHLDLPQHVLRFWETRFTQIKPLKRGGGRRYYRPEDVELLAGIRHLLYGEGYTIKGVQRILREQGARFVMEIGQNPAAHTAVGIATQPQQAQSSAPAPRQETNPAPVSPAYSAHQELPYSQQDGDLFAADDVDPEQEPVHDQPAAPSSYYAEPEEPLPAGLLPDTDDDEDSGSAPSALRFMDRLRGGDRAGQDEAGRMTKEEVRLLQSTLFELLECKRMLDQAR